MAFEKLYAQYYDLFYKDKDYQAECDFLEQVFQRFAHPIPRRILDMGCGTGGHAIPLAQRGYQMVGIDLSTHMIEKARDKAETASVDISFLTEGMHSFRAVGQFDAVISLFNALDHVLTDEDLLATFHNAYMNLRENGLFIFDFRNGFPSFSSYEPHRVKRITHDRLEILRLSRNRLNPVEQLFETEYEVIVMQNNTVLHHFHDKQHVRFFFPLEIKRYLRENGFDMLKMCPCFDLNGAVDESVWNILVVARKKA